MKRISKTSRKILGLLLILSASVLITTLFYFLGFLDSWQDKILDRFFIKKDTPPEIIIISLDNESITSLGGWPLRRASYGNLIENLSGAEAIGIDVSFIEKSQFGELDDNKFIESLGNVESKIVLPSQFDGMTKINTKPHPQFENYAQTGSTNILINQDGITRTIHAKIDDEVIFAAALFEKKIFIPDNFRIDFYGPERTFLTIPAIDVINDKIPGRIFEGKKVLIGATAPDLQDFVLTPFGRMPGVELHANILATIESGNFFRPTHVALAIFLFLLLSGAITLVVYKIQSFLTLTFYVLGIGIITVIVSLLSFGSYHVLPILYMMLVLFFTTSGSVTFQYISESSEKRVIKKTFEHYLAPEIIKEILEDPKKLSPGGAKKKVSILFSDIRGFTTISENLTPEELMEWLNAYLHKMTKVILENKGLVDKYIGDAIMALWGAPVPNPEHAVDAVNTAKGMVEILNIINKEMKQNNKHPFQIGIGISTGDVIVGNLGGKDRFNYTIIGDEVNFASRLEGLNKVYGTTCIVSDSLVSELNDREKFKLRELDLVRVKGKKEPRKIYELITDRIDTNLLTYFEDGRRFYVKGNWTEAIKKFKAALAIGDDCPSRVFLERSEHFRRNPPINWMGVYDATSK